MFLFALLIGNALLGSVYSARQPGRRLLQTDASLLRVVSFAELPPNTSALCEVSGQDCSPINSVPEEPLADSDVFVNVTGVEAPLFGAHTYSPEQVQEIFDAVLTFREPISPEQANVTFVSAPGAQFRASSVAQSFSAMRALRIPSIFHPPSNGHRFVLADTGDFSESTLIFANMTLVMPNATFETLSDSGLRDYITADAVGTRFCFGNSQFILRSCEGFPRNSEEVLWCCTQTVCRLFNQPTINDLNFRGLDILDPLSCFATEPLMDDGSGSRNTFEDIVVPILSTAAAVVLIMILALVLLMRYRKQQARAEEKEAAIKQQMSTFQQQLEKEKEASKNEKAELQKMRAQYNMLARDLIANTGDGSASKTLSKETAPREASNTQSRAQPEDASLHAVAPEEEQDAKAIQKQLRSVLHAADERTPVSVQAEIGRGAFGVVYRGVWKNIQVAIKTVLFQANGDIHSDPVLREAMLALRIAHPNLVATYRANVRMLEDAGLPTAGGGSGGNIQFNGDITPSYQLFLLQEYCDSGTLYDWLSRERMHPGNVPDKALIVRCALDISRGVQHLHHSEIIHGDLKPQNIMLTTVSSGVRSESPTARSSSFPYAAKLTDFGLSFHMDNKTHMSNMRIGTPFYYAPEVQAKGYLSKAADMYSFGVLLWEMFHGMPPYAADNRVLVPNASFPRFDLRHREDAPFSYVVVALACLSEDFSKRPKIDDVVTVLEDLNEGLSGTPDASMLMRNASLKRLTQGSYKAGFAAPTSLSEQASAASAADRASSSGAAAAGPSGGSSGEQVSEIVLRMLRESGLNRDADLKRRLEVTDATELQRLAGGKVTSAPAAREGAGNMHQSQRWMFDVLPPSSLAEEPTAALPKEPQQ